MEHKETNACAFKVVDSEKLLEKIEDLEDTIGKLKYQLERFQCRIAEKIFQKNAKAHPEIYDYLMNYL